MTRYIKHILLFLLPLLVYGAVVRYVDPYNYFGKSKMSYTHQKEYAYPINRILYRLIEFNKTDKTKILIGDSRLNYIGALTDTAETEFFNFSVGGASMYQMVDVFEYVTSIKKVEEVVFQVSFDDFNEQQDYSEMSNAITIQKNYLLYIYNISNLKVLYTITRDYMLGKQPSIGDVTTDKETYWQQCLKNERDFHTAKNYVYGNSLKQRLTEMVNFCETHNIRLTFVLLPVHNDVLKIVKEKNSGYYSKFKTDIAEIAGRFEFIDVSEMPVIHQKESFSDPYHLKNDSVRIELFNRLTRRVN